MEDEEGQPEDGEGVLGAQVAVVQVDVELFGEAVDREHGEIFSGWVDVGEVVAGLIEQDVAEPPAEVKLACGSGKPTLT